MNHPTSPATAAVGTAILALKPVTIVPDIASKVEALSQATVAEVESKVGLLRGLRIVDGHSLAAADNAYQMARKLHAAIEAQRKALKAPFLAAERAIDAAANPVLELLDSEIAKARQLINGWNAEQQRLAAEAERKRIAEEARLQREEEERAAAARKAAEDKRARDVAAAADLAELLGEEGAKPVFDDELLPNPPPAPVHRIIKPASAPAPILSTAVSSRTEKRAEVFDSALVPDVLEGEILKELKLAAIERLLKRNIVVPGARLVDRVITTTRA